MPRHPHAPMQTPLRRSGIMWVRTRMRYRVAPAHATAHARSYISFAYPLRAYVHAYRRSSVVNPISSIARRVSCYSRIVYRISHTDHHVLSRITSVRIAPHGSSIMYRQLRRAYHVGSYRVSRIAYRVGAVMCIVYACAGVFDIACIFVNVSALTPAFTPAFWRMRMLSSRRTYDHAACGNG
jgi:hypothetical protein